MKCLLDTSSFIWFSSGDDTLPQRALNTIKDIDNKCFISIASIWEIAIKSSLKKLELRKGFSTIRDFLADNNIEILPITFGHLQKLTNLPFHHRDPFDRIIISQGLVEHLVIITKDEQFLNYTDRLMWK